MQERLSALARAASRRELYQIAPALLPRIKRWKYVAAWIVLFCYVCTCSLYLVLFAIQQGRATSGAWLVSLVVSVTQDVFITQLVKVIILDCLVMQEVSRSIDDITSALREVIWREMLAIHADQQFGIGVLSEAPQPIVVSDRLRNVPQKGKWAWEPGSHFGVHRIDECWFGDAPQDLAQVSE